MAQRWGDHKYHHTGSVFAPLFFPSRQFDWTKDAGEILNGTTLDASGPPKLAICHVLHVSRSTERWNGYQIQDTCVEFGPSCNFTQNLIMSLATGVSLRVKSQIEQQLL